MKKFFWATACILGLAQLQFGQTNVLSGAASSDNAVGSTAPSTSSDADQEGRLSRWLDINTLSSSLRYRSLENSGGIHMFDFGQHRELVDGSFKLDREGKYAIHFHASSGRYINWAYADAIGGQFSDQVPLNTPHLPSSVGGALFHAIQVDPEGLAYARGIDSRGGYIYMRQLYLSATPVKQVTFEFGSLAIEHGENTEATSFDDDAYIAGERVRVHDSEHLYFDEIDGTWAYLGDAITPNFFSRGERLAQNNYQQYLVKKEFGRIGVSTDYTRLRGTNTMREAIRAKLPELHLIDSARLELYQRTNNVAFYGVNFSSGAGLSVSGSKTIAKRLQLEGGYASIDSNYAAYSGSPFLGAIGFSWNSDSFMTGHRFFTRGNLKVASGVSLFAFFTHDLDEAPYVINRQGVNCGMTVDLAPWMHKAHLL